MTAAGSGRADSLRERWVDVRGTSIRVRVRGSGRPLLMLMGIGASLDLWQPLADRLVLRNFSVITLDLPGAGLSEAPFPPVRMDGLADVVDAVATHLDLESYDLLGVSFGGIVAQEVARRHPGRVRRLTLCATAPGLGGLPGKPSALIHMWHPLRYWSRGYARRVAPHIYGGQARRGEPGARATLHHRFDHAPSLYGYLTQMYAVTGWSSLPWLRTLRARTLVLHGTDDPIVPTTNGRLLAKLIPDARLYLMEGGGHLFVLDEPGHTAAVVGDFLAAP
ncbi:alpha/beta fold hydrolase [Actinomycetota bacterium]